MTWVSTTACRPGGPRLPSLQLSVSGVRASTRCVFSASPACLSPSQRLRPLPAPYLQSLTYVSPEAPGTSQILFFGYNYRLLEEGDRHYHLNGTHSWQHNAQVSTEERANTFQTVTTVILWDLRSNLPYKTHPR